MAPDRKYTRIPNADSLLREVSFMPSTVETIDRAMFNYVDNELDLFSQTNKGWEKVPVLWVSAERAFQIKRDKGLRDSKGILKLPLITVERKGITKDPNFKGVAWSHIPELNDEKGGALVVARRIKQDKTSNFINADTARLEGSMSAADVGVGQQNFPSKTSAKVVYETVSIPVPTYVAVNYEIIIRTEYQQQINDLISPFITKTGQITAFVMKHEGHMFEGFIEGDFSQSSNVAQLNEEERMYETSIKIKVLGYLIGEGENDDRPIVRVDENIVEISYPRESTLKKDEDGFYTITS